MRTAIGLGLSMILFSMGVIGAQTREMPQSEQTFLVEKIVVATAVESREPVGESKEYDSSIEHVYCWMKISVKNVPMTVTHVWYAGDKKELEVPLTLRYSSTRTWSQKRVWPGKWRVDVVNDAGEVLSSVNFIVRE